MSKKSHDHRYIVYQNTKMKSKPTERDSKYITNQRETISPRFPDKVITIWGSNMAFHALTFARSRGRCWKPRPPAAVFNTSHWTWRMLMHWKTMFDRYYWIKTINICYISRYCLHYFVSPFHRCLANAISTDYAHSRAGQYTSRNGSCDPGTIILKAA